MGLRRVRERVRRKVFSKGERLDGMVGGWEDAYWVVIGKEDEWNAGSLLIEWLILIL